MASERKSLDVDVRKVMLYVWIGIKFLILADVVSIRTACLAIDKFGEEKHFVLVKLYLVIVVLRGLSIDKPLRWSHQDQAPRIVTSSSEAFTTTCPAKDCLVGSLTPL